MSTPGFGEAHGTGLFEQHGTLTLIVVIKLESSLRGGQDELAEFVAPLPWARKAFRSLLEQWPTVTKGPARAFD